MVLGLHRLFNYYHFSSLVITEGEASTGGDGDGVTAEPVRNPGEDEKEQGVRVIRSRM